MVKKIRKRDGSVVPFNEEKIVEAIWKAVKAVGGTDKDRVIEINSLIIAQLQKIHGEKLTERGILYAPDFVINAGGMINVFVEAEGYDRERAMRMTRAIYYNLRKVFDISRTEGISTAEAADRLAEERIVMVRQLKNMYTGQARHYLHLEKGGRG